MSFDPIIHWEEGLFLQPHHLQRMQKGFLDALTFNRRVTCPHPYGVLEARISREELENHRLRFDRLRAVMPGGLVIDVPGNCDLGSRDFKQEFSRGSGTVRVAVGVPLWFDRRRNTDPGQTADLQSRFLYRVDKRLFQDENTGDNEQELRVRRINARLVFDQEDTSDLDLLPLMRIVRASGEDLGKPREDYEFIPPCLVLEGSAVLRELVRDLVAVVQGNAAELAREAGRGFGWETLRGVEIEQMMRLRAIARGAARLPALLEQAHAIPPFQIYLELRDLLAELAAIHPERGGFDTAPYDHDNPGPCFQELSRRIREHLVVVARQGFLKVDFRNADGLLLAALEDDHFTGPNAYYLGIKTKRDPALVAQQVGDGNKFKLMSRSRARLAVRGVELRWESQAPPVLPKPVDMHYFRLERTGNSANRWQEIRNEKSAILVWDPIQNEYWEDATFALFMTIPT